MTTQLITKLPAILDPTKIPQHVAAIMDGNGRWAKQQGLPRIAGHQQGANTVRSILRCCKDWGIANFTVYAFSTENWGRPEAEVNFLMRLFEGLLDSELDRMHAEGVRIRFLGDRSQVPIGLRNMMDKSIKKTVNNRAVTFNIAINYGSRNEILQACRSISKRVKNGELETEQIDESLFAKYLDTHGLPDPDLLIRTSGEQRLSNFLLWQLAYTEIYITNTHWPDFSNDEFTQAIADYQQRNRRFGKV
ncbi:isoprenyl transferase [Chamaesiphon sp. VAR_48_metabat_135_sub]|uniref:isoprenyl transferase n=1 Tax=Chamaesiphon sp. VAR_48_metabat_135_sub TaxID=2964699 RepID=UPI00286A9925|nr:isoprenyl transferase [Chamaesiphon sp. VAR_48_metabat_135_sub]